MIRDDTMIILDAGIETSMLINRPRILVQSRYDCLVAIGV